MTTEGPDRFEAARLAKLQEIEALGHDPWGARFDGHVPIRQARAQCPTVTGEPGAAVRVAGRIMLRNNKGKLQFFHIQDWTGRIQLMCSRAEFSEEQWKLIELLDLGDLVGIDGRLTLSNTGEVTVRVSGAVVLTKSLVQPPEKFHGARDVEMLRRQRYLDLIYNPPVLERMLARTRIIDAVRTTLRERGYAEVETPVLHSIAGGAPAARPFVTHHNALDMQLYLRIALELHLKRLMVGGLERVYEIGRVFRNEGIDSTHNPEFTMLEAYQAYGDYGTMMDLTEALVTNAVRAALPEAPEESAAATLVRPWGDDSIDFTPPWLRITYAEVFRQHTGCDMADSTAVGELARKHFAPRRSGPDAPRPKLDLDQAHPDVVVNELFDELVQPQLRGPVFVIDYPASLCPLTKRKRGQPEVAERFELFVEGMELANAYTELNDPRLQEELFRTQLAGLAPEESMARMDHDFVRALKVGMPPAGGLGVGIDRLVMLLTDTSSIRDVIFFPLLRPET